MSETVLPPITETDVVEEKAKMMKRDLEPILDLEMIALFSQQLGSVDVDKLARVNLTELADKGRQLGGDEFFKKAKMSWFNGVKMMMERVGLGESVSVSEVIEKMSERWGVKKALLAQAVMAGLPLMPQSEGDKDKFPVVVMGSILAVVGLSWWLGPKVVDKFKDASLNRKDVVLEKEKEKRRKEDKDAVVEKSQKEEKKRKKRARLTKKLRKSLITALTIGGVVLGGWGVSRLPVTQKMINPDSQAAEEARVQEKIEELSASLELEKTSGDLDGVDKYLDANIREFVDKIEKGQSVASFPPDIPLDLDRGQFWYFAKWDQFISSDYEDFWRTQKKINWPEEAVDKDLPLAQRAEAASQYLDRVSEDQVDPFARECLQALFSQYYEGDFKNNPAKLELARVAWTDAVRKTYEDKDVNEFKRLFGQILAKIGSEQSSLLGEDWDYDLLTGAYTPKKDPAVVNVRFSNRFGDQIVGGGITREQLRKSRRS